MRPHQWAKNLLLLFPPFFGGFIASPDTILNVAPALFSFCAAASTGYIINDIRDIEVDKNHEMKRMRGLASGEVSVISAYFFALTLFVVALALSFYISPVFCMYLILYLVISLSYTFYLKNIVIVDIFTISFGFLVRVLAGGEAFSVSVSKWLFMAVFLVALFLATGKRMGELVLLEEVAKDHRKCLADYSIAFLEGLLWFSASAALVTYALYTLEHGTVLFYTVPLAAFGLLRYIYIARKGKGDPTEALLKDPQIMGVGILWAVIIAVVVYG